MSVGAERSVHVCVIELPQARPVVGPRAPVASHNFLVPAWVGIGRVPDEGRQEEAKNERKSHRPILLPLK